MFENISPEDFAKGIANEENVVLVDVRTPAEWEEGIIPGAVMSNIMSPAFQAWVMDQDKDKSYYIYCKSGGRSANACGFMAQNGFTKLYNLDGGITAWNGETTTP